MIAILSSQGTLATVDGEALYQYCRMFAETEAIAVTQIETASTIDLLEENLHGEDRDDIVAVVQEITKLRQLESRYTTQIRQGRMALRAYLIEFGLTPAARTRVKVTDAKVNDKPISPLAALQSAARGLRAV